MGAGGGSGSRVGSEGLSGSRITRVSSWLGRGAACCSVGGSGSLSSRTVDRKRSASGPSRILARLRRAIRQDLLGQLAVVVGGVSVRIVLEDARASDGRLGELDRLADPGL